jgi:hypothetical protein
MHGDRLFFRRFLIVMPGAHFCWSCGDKFPRCSHTVQTVVITSSHKVATLWELVGTLWEPVFHYRAPLRGDVCTIFMLALSVHGHRSAYVIRSGPAVTVRADPVFVRADSSSPWDTVIEARICSNAFRPSFELPFFKGHPLTYCVCPKILILAHRGHVTRRDMSDR